MGIAPPLSRLWRVVIVAVVIAAAVALRPSAAHALDPGTNAVVRADGDCLNLRAEPSLSGAVVVCLAEGTTVSVLEGTRFADGYTWQFVSASGRSGWAVEQYLRAAPASAATPAPAAAATPVATPPPAAPSLTGALPTAGGFAIAVWGGGALQAMLGAASNQGCRTSSVWANRAGGGDFVGYIVGAPPFVNAPWNDQFAGGLPAATPVIVVCAGAATAAPAAASSPPPASTPSAPPSAQPTPGLPPDIPPRPPGPAGNA